jgi:tRNA (cytidine56-2'-O)-methyltransferase
MRVSVLRLGHRKGRDARVTTHVGLASRAFGAGRIILSGDRDPAIMDSLRKVVENWGGDFGISYEGDWQAFLKGFSGTKVHLTMYGLPVYQVVEDLRQGDGEVLLVVGAEKVPGLVYELVDYNVSVTNQPHSEVSAVAVFLDRLFKGRELHREFPEGKRRIVPSAKGKEVIMQPRAQGRLPGND